MIESAAPISFTSHPPLQNISFIKVLIKRGLISDLARCMHNLDLSSHDLVSTVNIMLKPLEKLTNLANTQSVQSTKPENKDLKGTQSASTVETIPTGMSISVLVSLPNFKLDGVLLSQCVLIIIAIVIIIVSLNLSMFQ